MSTLRVDTIANTAGVTNQRVLQVLQTVKTDTFSTSSSTFADITGMAVSITPSSASNKILVMYTVNVSEDSSQFPIIRILRGATDIASGAVSGSRTSGTSSSWGGGAVNNTNVQTMQFLDSPSTTSATTYKLQVISTASQAFYLNKNERDNDANYEPRLISTITVMEIAGLTIKLFTHYILMLYLLMMVQVLWTLTVTQLLLIWMQLTLGLILSNTQ